MALARVLPLLVLGLGLPACSASAGGRFRGSRDDGPTATVSAGEVESSLQASLEAMLHGGEGAAAQRLASIEASLWSTFQALPKTPAGRLEPRAVRYLVHKYFAQEHGWLIKGLEPHGMQLNMTEVHEVRILQDKAPALAEALLEARHAGRGLALSDVVAMAAALERLIFQESLVLLEAAYALNGRASAEPLGEGPLHEVLQSYLLLFELGHKGNLSDARRHQAIKARVAAAGGSWPILVDFERDAVRNFDFAKRDQTNPFLPREFPFQAAAHIVEDLAHGYGKWQNTECRQMREELMGLDPDGSGRVPLAAFYAQPETADYQFTESVEYLREIGALEEEAGGPRVRIANYMAGPSNCIASSSYYSVCCLSDCEGLMSELEGELRAPTAPAERLLRLVGNLSSSSVDAPRQLPAGLEERLRAVAQRHGGEVPLHGRLFAQWMHFAFPNECPYPHVSEDAAVLTPGHWQERRATAPKEVRRQHVEAAGQTTAGTAPAAAAVPAATLHWSEDEVLPLSEPPRSGGRGALGSAARMAVQLLLLLVLLRSLLAGLRTAARASGARPGKGKGKDFLLPLH